MSEWISVDDKLPELDVPVWVYLPKRASWRPSMVIGCRSEDSEGNWSWCRCYDDIWYDDREEQWSTCTAEAEDYHPTHWKRLPMPPDEP